MGDVLSLVEKAESAIKLEDADAMTRRIMEAKFDFNDFLAQFKMVSGMGNMASVMKMIPGRVLATFIGWALPNSTPSHLRSTKSAKGCRADWIL